MKFDLHASTISTSPKVFLDKQGHPVIITLLGPEYYEQLLDMYFGYLPRGSIEGIPPFSDEECRQWVRRIIDEGISLVALSFEKNVIGHIVLFPMKKKTCEMLIAVFPQYQKNGIGTQLMRCAVQLAYEIGFHRMWLSVSKTNFVAIHLYNKCGFERVAFTESSQVEMSLDLKRYHPAADIKIRDVMNRQVISVNQNLTCREAVEIFLQNNIDALPVVSDAAGVVGILSQTDLIFKQNIHRKISDIATREVVTVQEDSTIDKAISLFQSKTLRCLPVLNRRKKLVGVLGRKDILAYYFKNYKMFS